MELTPEMLAKAKMSKSAEELLTLAKENGINLTDEEAKRYFSQWHWEGELADEELENVTGGSHCINGRSYSDDPPHRLIVTTMNSCDKYADKVFGRGWQDGYCPDCIYCYQTTTNNYCKIRTDTHDMYNSAIGNDFYWDDTHGPAFG